MGFNGFVFYDSRGFTGIALGWKPKKLQVHVLKCHFQFIHSQTTTEEGKVWHLSAIYDSPLEERKKELWTELDDIATSMNTRWIRGDFNDILHLNAKIGGLPHTLRRFNLFKTRINKCNLLDMGCFGFSYSWRGPVTHRGMKIYEKLDCILCNDRWRNLYP